MRAPTPRMWVLVVVTVLGALAAVLLVAVAVIDLSPVGGGCTDRDWALRRPLSAESILNAFPADKASPAGDIDTGCDPDDGFARAGRRFHPLGTVTRSEISAYYTREAPRHGWRLTSVNEHPVPEHGLVISGAHLCFEKAVRGTTAYLALWWPGDFGGGEPDYGLEITASIDGSASC